MSASATRRTRAGCRGSQRAIERPLSVACAPRPPGSSAVASADHPTRRIAIAGRLRRRLNVPGSDQRGRRGRPTSRSRKRLAVGSMSANRGPPRAKKCLCARPQASGPLAKAPFAQSHGQSVARDQSFDCAFGGRARSSASGRRLSAERIPVWQATSGQADRQYTARDEAVIRCGRQAATAWASSQN